VSPRLRVALVVAAFAALAAVVVAGAAVLSAVERPAQPAQDEQPQPRAGVPPLALDFGVRADAAARELRRAAALYADGRRDEAAAIFEGHDSLEAKLGAAFARWPGTLERVEQLGALYPRSAVAQLHVGLARFWAGRAGAEEAWREARDSEPDTPYAVRASGLLHSREFAPGLPVFVPKEPFPEELQRLSPAAQLERLRERAQAPFDSRLGLVAKLHYGVALQRLGRPLSARRAYDLAVEAYPDDPEALVAAAVGRFEKERPEVAFSQLGPLARRFPRAATVRFHLGLLLLWSRQIEEAKTQLRGAERAEPGSPLAREARRYLDELAKAGTG
jgi:tetratricopeptide (TPR) repeat protein